MQFWEIIERYWSQLTLLLGVVAAIIKYFADLANARNEKKYSHFLEYKWKVYIDFIDSYLNLRYSTNEMAIYLSTCFFDHPKRPFEEKQYRELEKELIDDYVSFKILYEKLGQIISDKGRPHIVSIYEKMKEAYREMRSFYYSKKAVEEKTDPELLAKIILEVEGETNIGTIYENFEFGLSSLTKDADQEFTRLTRKVKTKFSTV